MRPVVKILCSFGRSYFRLGRIACTQWMRPISTDVARSVVCVSIRVCLCGYGSAVQKTAELIEMSFEAILWVQGTMY